MSTETLIVLASGRGRWGLAQETVRAITRRGNHLEIATDTGTVRADEVLEMGVRVAVRSPGAIVARYWPYRCAGLAVHAGAPLVVVSAAEPPSPLRAQ